MTHESETNPFTPLRARADYALEWEVVTPEGAFERVTTPRDDHGLTPADRAALGLSPADPRHLHGSTGGDAKGVLGRVLR